MSSWTDLRRFLDKHGKLIRKGKHFIYAYQGRTVRVSNGTGEIGRDLWRDILKHELQITQEEFNAAL